MKRVIFAVAAITIAIVLFFVLRSQRESNTQDPVVSPVVRDEKIPEGTRQESRQENQARAVAPGFTQVSERAWMMIPKISDTQKLSAKDTHHTPLVIQKAALALGDLAQLIHDKPENRRDGLRFYEKCAMEDTFPMSIRAVCLSGYRKVAKDLGERGREDGIPAQVRALTDQIDH